MKLFSLIRIRLIDRNIRITNVICIVKIFINGLINTVIGPASDVSDGDNFILMK